MSAWPIRVIHFGLGRFHRAHQAVYFQNLFEKTGERWGIASFSMRSSEASDQMRSVQNRYPVLQFSKSDQKVQWVDSICESNFAKQDHERMIELFASTNVELLTLTVTEKAYQTPELIKLITDGLRSRFEKIKKPLTVLSCDNLLSNGEKLQQSVIRFAGKLGDKQFTQWITSEVTFPNTMVDRIVPALTPDRLVELQKLIDNKNSGIVATELFSQWVIEDDFAGAKPALEKVGVQFVEDVQPFEEMKLRLLNASHSAIAYMGLLSGYTFVHEAIRDPNISSFIRDLHKEIIPLLNLPASFDLQSYCNTLLDRFDNERLPHQLKQIAMDGSQKLQQRILPSLKVAVAQSLSSQRLSEVLDAWAEYCFKNVPDDPISSKIIEIKSTAKSFEEFRLGLLQAVGLRDAQH